MTDFTRRGFIRNTGGLMAASAAVLAGQRHGGAAEQSYLRHAVIGVGGQGSNHARTFSSMEDCRVVAVCDVSQTRRAALLEKLPDSENILEFSNFDELLARDDIDTVSIATPDHWHTPAALAALKAGKHVYVEKPCSHNVHESYALVDAAKKTGLCVQHGTQSRSGEGIIKAIQFLRDGHLGKVRLAKAINHQMRGPIGRKPATDPPPGVDYDRWLGPAPVVPFTENRWHYNWHWFWDYGTGDMGNDGIHQLDVACWGLNVGLPKHVTAAGGQLFYDDDHETPDTQVVTYEYDDCYLLFEMRLWTNYKMEGHDNGVVFYGDNGTVEVGRDGCFVTYIGKDRVQLGGSHDLTANVRNFLDCVIAENPAGLNAPISEGAISATLCHLGNIGTRVGRRLHFDAERIECTGDEEATTLLKRAYRAGYELPVIA